MSIVLFSRRVPLFYRTFPGTHLRLGSERNKLIHGTRMRNIASFVLFVHGKHARTTPPTVSSCCDGENVGVREADGTRN